MQSAVVILATLGVGVITGYKLHPNATAKTEVQQTDTTHTVIKTVKDKAGREKTVTTIDSKTDVVIKKQENLTKESSKTNVSALIGNDFSKSIPQPIYGISVNRQYWGPVTIGAFGFNNGLLGVSIGLNF